ncbi:MAG: PTS transporter subunit EIIC, partial [Negativicutes bacterium]|nr:PTS transporter subunit EIIC [Negativicutes bacterium]
MSEKNARDLAEQIIARFGGVGNISSAGFCMTRLRLTPFDKGRVEVAAIRQLSGVMGVVEAGDQLQIILGPGFVKKVADEVSAIRGVAVGEVAAAGDLQDRVAAIKARPSAVKDLLKKLANIFVPLIPAIIACGMVKGLLNVALNLHLLAADSEGFKILEVTGGAVFGYLAVLVGVNAAKEFNATPSLGAVAGILTILPSISKITVYGQPLVPGRGGLLGVILIVFFMSLVERRVRRFVHDSVDLIVTPTITLLITAFATYFVLQPIAGVVSDGILAAFLWLLNSGSWWAGALMSMLFLPTVVTGLHHGLIPIHAELLARIGENGLWPVLSMAGAGQVGAAIAVLWRTKNKNLKNICRGALPVGILGVGEPLIFGVTLPLGRPFITACVGAAFGGAWCATMH